VFQCRYGRNKKNKNTKNHIHDKFFREFFSCLSVARHFLLKWLPEKIKDDTNFDTLTLEQNDFNPALLGSDELIADLIFSADRINKKAKNYFIIEHKSYFDSQALFQLIVYQTALWLRLSKNKNAKHKLHRKKLPMVYLILVHQAKRPLKIIPNLKHLIDAPDDLIENYFLKSPILIDLAAGGENLSCAERWMKDYHKSNPLELFKKTAAELIEMRSVSGQNYLSMVEYILGTQSAETIHQIELFLQSHEEITMRAARNDFVSYADELIKSGWQKGRQEGHQEGLQKGIKQGMEQGVEKGRWEAMLDMAKALIRQGSSPELVLQITGLSEQDIAALC
jgi:predicted transposase YdaD